MASRKEQKAAARERLRQEMERRKRRTRRNRIIGLAAGVLVLALIATGGVLVYQKQQRDEAEAKAKQRAAIKARTPDKIDKDGLSVPVGDPDAPVTLTVYEDFRCPACKQFEAAYGKSINKLVKEGKLKVKYRLVTIIDANVGGNGSKVAGNAALCANEVGQFQKLHTGLFASQPPEDQDLFTAQNVLMLSSQIKGLGDDPKFQKCVKKDQFRKWLPKVEKEFTKRFPQPSTPSLILDDKVMFGGEQREMASEMATPQQFEKTVNQRAKAAS
ncbi:MAG: thioredoxin domain-containing protein [Streptosporangiales bacterium]|nr:thioredoxin domain-containing protein [Streptosporangiales bacterium]